MKFTGFIIETLVLFSKKKKSGRWEVGRGGGGGGGGGGGVQCSRVVVLVVPVIYGKPSQCIWLVLNLCVIRGAIATKIQFIQLSMNEAHDLLQTHSY